MPRHRRHHRRNARYYLKKIFPFLFRLKKYRGTPIEAASPETKFLTMKEIKAAQAEALGTVMPVHDPGAPTIIGSNQMQQRPPIPLHRKRYRGFGGKLNKLFHLLTFRTFRKKHSSSKEIKYLSREEVKQAKENLGPFRSRSSDEREDQVQAIHLNQQKSGKKPKHRRKHRRSIFRRLFRRKPKEEPTPVIIPGEIPEEEKPKTSVWIYLRPILNSTAMFMIAYQLCWFLYQLTVMILASFSHIDSVLYYYEVMFPVGNYSPKWTQSNIIFITLSGPLVSLIMWAIYRYVMLRRFHPGQQMRIFLVWLCLNSMMLFFGAFVGGAITRQGFGYVVDWLYMNVAIRILFSLIFLMIIIWLSWKIARFLPESSGADSWKTNRYGFILSRLVIPWFIGSGIMVLLKLTDVIPQHENIFNYDALTLATLLFAVVPPLFNNKDRPHLIQNRKTYPRVHRTTVAFWIMIAVMLVTLVRIGLSTGLHFELSISFNLGWYLS